MKKDRQGPGVGKDHSVMSVSQIKSVESLVLVQIVMKMQKKMGTVFFATNFTVITMNTYPSIDWNLIHTLETATVIMI